MGQRGPAQKPDELKSVPKNPQAPQYDDEVVQPPDWLDEEAVAEWYRLYEYLQEKGLLKTVDRAEFANYCLAYSDLVDAVKRLKKEGKYLTKATKQGGHSTYLHPAISERDRAADRMHRYAAQFGFTPSTRVNVKAETKNHQTKKDNNSFFEEE